MSRTQSAALKDILSQWRCRPEQNSISTQAFRTPHIAFPLALKTAWAENVSQVSRYARAPRKSNGRVIGIDQ